MKNEWFEVLEGVVGCGASCLLYLIQFVLGATITVAVGLAVLRWLS